MSGVMELHVLIASLITSAYCMRQLNITSCLLPGFSSTNEKVLVFSIIYDLCMYKSFLVGQSLRGVVKQ